MSEAEFDLLLDAISAAVIPTEQDRLLRGASVEPPKAANDNQLTWPLIPFPDGWSSAC